MTKGVLSLQSVQNHHLLEYPLHAIIAIWQMLLEAERDTVRMLLQASSRDLQGA